jgi:hypothetical protein
MLKSKLIDDLYYPIIELIIREMRFEIELKFFRISKI